MESEYVCRTCLQIFTFNEVTHLNPTKDDSDSISLRQKLQACVPELTVDIVHDPVICNTCCAAIILTYQFKSSCLENEQTLYNFIKQRKQNPYDLLTISDLLQIVRKDINAEHSYSITEKCYSNDHISDSESDSESLKLPTTIQTSLKNLVKQALVGSSYFVDTEDTEEISKATTKAKVKNKRIKPSVKNEVSNEEVEKFPTTSATSLKNVDKLEEVSFQTNTSSKTTSTNTKHSMTTRESASSSAKNDHKQAINTKRGQLKKEDTFSPINTKRGQLKKEDAFSYSQPVENIVDSLEESGIPHDPEVTESDCNTFTNKVTRKKKRNTHKRNLRDGTNNRGPKESAKSLSKNIETTRNTEANKKKDKQNIANESSLAHDEATAEPQKKIFKKEIYLDRKTASKKITKHISTTPERQNDSKINGNENLPSPRPIKKSLSDRDIRITNQDALDNDLLEINQLILKNDLSELPNMLPNKRDAKRYRCTKCNKSYNFKSHFDVHLKSHIFKKLYTCPICNKDFAQEKYLKSHTTLHTSTGLYQCDICLKYLSAATALKRHYRTHTGEKPYPCARCNKSFAQKIQLAVHTRTHTGYRPFTCNVCKADFTQKSHLMGHIRIHTGEKPYKCDQCPKRFRKSYALQIHKHSHSVKPFQCRACNFLFKDSGTFQRHVNKHLTCITNTGSPVMKKLKSKRKILDELEQDVKDINMAVSLREQIDDDEFQIDPKETKLFLNRCNICNRGFTTKFSMKRHMKGHVL